MNALPDESGMVDVIVVGGCPAGMFASMELARNGLRVLLIDHPELIRPLPQRIWISSLAVELFQKAQLPHELLLNQAVKNCVFHSPDMARMIKPNLPVTPLYLVQTEVSKKIMGEALSASRLGRCEQSSQIGRISLGEELVTVIFKNRRQYRGRFLLLATYHGHPLVESLALPGERSSNQGLWTAVLECSAPVFAEAGRMDYFLGVGNASGFGYRLSRDGAVTLGVSVSSSAKMANELLQLLADRLATQNMWPANWQHMLSDVKTSWSPAGLCLEMESHVAKRTLLIGEAGGFVASTTNESFYPGIWSAKIACQVICEALASAHPQDKLRGYEQLWRMQMADYLRPPHTDAQSLLPMVFSNQQIADKLFQAMHLGVNF